MSRSQADAQMHTLKGFTFISVYHNVIAHLFIISELRFLNLYIQPCMRVSNHENLKRSSSATGCCSCLRSSPFSSASDLMTSNLSL